MNNYRGLSDEAIEGLLVSTGEIVKNDLVSKEWIKFRNNESEVIMLSSNLEFDFKVTCYNETYIGGVLQLKELDKILCYEEVVIERETGINNFELCDAITGVISSIHATFDLHRMSVQLNNHKYLEGMRNCNKEMFKEVNDLAEKMTMQLLKSIVNEDVTKFKIDSLNKFIDLLSAVHLPKDWIEDILGWLSDRFEMVYEWDMIPCNREIVPSVDSFRALQVELVY